MESNVHRYQGRPPPVVVLHGFTQHGGVFGELASHLDRELIAPDLPGHGATPNLDATIDDAVSQIAQLVHRAPVPLIGYSQGGRIALHLALRHPDLIARLVLISTSPGIADPAERDARRLADEILAGKIEEEGIETFLGNWLDNPMFSGLRRRGSGWLARDRQNREVNDPQGLAAALRGMGQGAQDYLGDQVSEVNVPTLLVVGAEDQRYVNMALDMASKMPRAEVTVVEGCGHSVIAEAPVETARIVTAFLDT